MVRKKAQASWWLSPNGLLAGLMYIICPRVCCLFVRHGGLKGEVIGSENGRGTCEGQASGQARRRKSRSRVLVEKKFTKLEK